MNRNLLNICLVLMLTFAASQASAVVYICFNQPLKFQGTVTAVTSDTSFTFLTSDSTITVIAQKSEMDVIQQMKNATEKMHIMVHTRDDGKYQLFAIVRTINGHVVAIDGDEVILADQRTNRLMTIEMTWDDNLGYTQDPNVVLDPYSLEPGQELEVPDVAVVPYLRYEQLNMSFGKGNLRMMIGYLGTFTPVGRRK